MVDTLQTNPVRSGARQLVEWFRSRGIPCIGISTGLSLFNEITKRELGLDEVLSNDLLFKDGICAGSVVVNVEETGKADVLESVCQRYHCEPGDAAIVFGDGVADIAMFEAARVAVAGFPRYAEVAKLANLVVDAEPIDRICDDVAGLLV